jgi:AcrR family transcriptional regulator
MSEIQPAEASAQNTARQERGNRILDVAAALILRWGYNKTTIDDIARQAGVAKGTIYLHWNTREELFAALLRRERAHMSADVRRRIAADPQGGTLRSVLKHTALALIDRPLMKAVLLGDLGVLGKLAHREHSTSAYTERLAGFTAYLDVLREHGLLRSDVDQRAQVYTLSAVFMGFFLVAPLMPDGWTLADAELAELLAETVDRMLSSAAGTPEAIATANDAYTRYVDRSIAQRSPQQE